MVIKISFFFGNLLAVQWLGLCASTAGDTGSIPGQGTKILHATQPKKKKSFLSLLFNCYLVIGNKPAFSIHKVGRGGIQGAGGLPSKENAPRGHLHL